jgi:beta-phosphoglucomutase-like phosphatase (HAD superfamily)
MADCIIAVLDIDGTLIDSNNQHALAWSRALRWVGDTYPVWRLHRLIGMGGDQVPTALGGEDLERRVGDQRREQQGQEVDALLEEIAPLPGARDLLLAIKERGHRLVLASSGQQRHVDFFLDMLDARGIADDWISSSDVDASKPGPGPAAGGAEEAGCAAGCIDCDDRRLGMGRRGGEKSGDAGDRRPLRRLWGRRAPGGWRHRHLRHPR